MTYGRSAKQYPWVGAKVWAKQAGSIGDVYYSEADRSKRPTGRACYHLGSVGPFLPSIANWNIMADPENQPEQPKAAPEKQVIGK